MAVIAMSERALEFSSPANGYVTRVPSFPEAGEGDYALNPVHDVDSSSITEDRLKMRVTVIDDSTLSRSCLMRCLAASNAEFTTEGYRSVDEWRQVATHGLISTVLLCATGEKSTEITIRRDINIVKEVAPEARVVVVSDLEDPTVIVGALEHGAKGYISMTANLEVAIAAINLVRAGGVFVPASGLAYLRTATSTPQLAAQANGKQANKLFTGRQLEVIDRLRKGESNKIIAYKLKMGECTVKVHVRNIMRKLKARNRTEVAFLTNDML
jgi:DNA-binding NarL/FixJ family response regulator